MTYSILFTSLYFSGKDLSLRYYCAKDGARRLYTDVMLTAEAAAKHLLSSAHIDEIIVLGAGRTYDPGEENKRIELRSWSDFTSKDAKDLSEYSFFQYRLAQFLDNIDMEALDVLADLDPKRQEELKRGYDAFISQEDIADDENEDLFEECDDVFYEHEQLIIDMIYEAAKTFTP